MTITYHTGRHKPAGERVKAFISGRSENRSKKKTSAETICEKGAKYMQHVHH